MKDHSSDHSQTSVQITPTNVAQRPVIVLGDPPNNATREEIEGYWPTITICEDDGR